MQCNGIGKFAKFLKLKYTQVAMSELHDRKRWFKQIDVLENDVLLNKTFAKPPAKTAN